MEQASVVERAYDVLRHEQFYVDVQHSIDASGGDPVWDFTFEFPPELGINSNTNCLLTIQLIGYFFVGGGTFADPGYIWSDILPPGNEVKFLGLTVGAASDQYGAGGVVRIPTSKFPSGRVRVVIYNNKARTDVLSPSAGAWTDTVLRFKITRQMLD